MKIYGFVMLGVLLVTPLRADQSSLPSPVNGKPIPQRAYLGFGNDDRQPMLSDAYPWSAIGRVVNEDGSHCTGSLIGRYTVITNAHCVNSETMKFYPNYKQGQATDSANSYIFIVDTSLDWGFLRLDRPLGDKYGWLRYEVLKLNELDGLEVNYSGYSVFKNEEKDVYVNGQTAGIHIGCHINLKGNTPNTISHDCDNGRGGSGGPLFTWKNDRAYLVALNSAEYRSSDYSYWVNDDQVEKGYGNVAIPIITFQNNLKAELRSEEPFTLDDKKNLKKNMEEYTRCLTQRC